MTLSSSATDPLLSILITLYTLILLYFPALIFSTVLILTSLLLLSFLHHGFIQRKNQPQISLNNHELVVSSESCGGEVGSVLEPSPNPVFADSFIEWDVRAPLEVIYEGEGEENEDFLEEKRESQMGVIEKYGSLSKFYPDTDSDSSSEKEFMEIGAWELPRSPCFSWEVEDKEGLIEIKLEENGCFEIEEESMIEIDLSPANLSAR